MRLDNRIRALIAVGASVAANCQPCLAHNLGAALEWGADDQEIAEAVEVGKRVREGAAAKMDEFASGPNLARNPATGRPDPGCGCGRDVTATGAHNG